MKIKLLLLFFLLILNSCDKQENTQNVAVVKENNKNNLQQQTQKLKQDKLDNLNGKKSKYLVVIEDVKKDNCKPKLAWIEYSKYPPNEKNEFVRIICQKNLNYIILSYYYYKKQLDFLDSENVAFKSNKYIVQNLDNTLSDAYYSTSDNKIKAFDGDYFIGEYIRIY